MRGDRCLLLSYAASCAGAKLREAHVLRTSSECPVVPLAGLLGPATCPIFESAPEKNRTAHGVIAPILELWVQGTPCYWVQSEEFCAYTLPTFNGGEGVSFITSRDRIVKLAGQPLYESDGVGRLLPKVDASSVPYEDAEVPGKGVGLVATRPIRSGSRIMARTPSVMVDGKALEHLSQVHMAELLSRAIDQLPTGHRDKFLNLSTHTAMDDKASRAHRIFSINRFRTGINDGGSEFHAAFVEGPSQSHLFAAIIHILSLCADGCHSQSPD